MYKSAIKNVLDKLINHETEIKKVLCSIESTATADDEFKSAVNCLKGAEEKEGTYWGDNVDTFAAFMAVNQPLYGLILGLLSSLAAKETYIRPASDTKHIVLAINEILRLEEEFPNFHIKTPERQVFLDQYVRIADAVYFVGEYNNAKKVQTITKSNALFMFSGTGMNPMIINENADISLAVEKAVEAGLYNSGQDCGKPKVYLVHKAVEQEFNERMMCRLEEESCGNFGDPNAQIVPLLRNKDLQNAVDTILNNCEDIYCGKDKRPCGGYVDLARKLIMPTMLKVSLDNKVIFKESFAPIFVTATYDSAADLKKYFADDRYFQNSMYAFVFGDLPDGLDISAHTVVIHNQSLLDVENGNLPFGGYGKRANFVYDGSSPQARPFLVTEELYKFGNKRKRKNKKAA